MTVARRADSRQDERTDPREVVVAGADVRAGDAGGDDHLPGEARRGRGGAPAGVAHRPGLQPQARPRLHQQLRRFHPYPRHRIVNTPAGLIYLSGVMHMCRRRRLFITVCHDRAVCVV